MTSYQLFLIITLAAWPFVLAGLLFGMSWIESLIERARASTPEEAGLEPAAGDPAAREVRIVFGDQVVPSPEERPAPDGRVTVGDEDKVPSRGERAEG
jgi:hypothetical protein